MLAQLDVRSELSFTLHKIVGIDRPCVPFRPSEMILVENVSETISVPEKIVFWGGAEKEIATLEKQKERKAQAARRREEMRGVGAAPSSSRPEQPTRPKSHLTKKEDLRNHLLAIGDAADGADHQSPDLFGAADEPSGMGDGGFDEDYSFLQELSDGDVAPPKLTGEDLDTRLCDLYGDLDCEDLAERLDPVYDYPDLLDDEDAAFEREEDLFGPDSDSEGCDGLLVPSNEVESTPVPQSERSRVFRGAKGCCTEDLSAVAAPAGATLRKYEPLNGPPYWQAQLPKGVRDRKGRQYRTRRWANGKKTEGQVLHDLQNWLWGAIEGGEGDSNQDSSSD